jgi:drug/metabolite transporter (DMT)-like permease
MRPTTVYLLGMLLALAGSVLALFGDSAQLMGSSGGLLAVCCYCYLATVYGRARD